MVNKYEKRFGFEALVAKPNFHSFTLLDDDLAVVQMKRTSVKLDRPIYIGVAILDLSKILIYDFHYGFMQKNMPESNLKLLYTDTGIYFFIFFFIFFATIIKKNFFLDSLIYEITDNDPYALMASNIERFDTSGYAADNQWNIPLANKRKPGLMSDEARGQVILAFCGLRAKCYSFKIQDREEEKRAKGVKNCVLKNTITFQDYHDCLFNAEEIYRDQVLIRSKAHEMTTVKQTKLALSANDDKRYVTVDCTDTLAFGHYKIKKDI